MDIKSIDPKDIEERFGEEIVGCKFIKQIIEKIFKDGSFYKLEPGKGFFIRFYIIFVDYLALKIIRLFDPAENGKYKNFSINYIKECEKFSSIEFPKKIEKDVKKLKNYRNKHLAHLDRELERNDFPSYREIMDTINILIKECHAIYEKIRKINGNESTLSDEVISKTPHDFLNIWDLGTYVNALNNETPEKQSILRNYRDWHKQEEQKELQKKKNGP
jgi:hypothetical protein